MVPWFRLLLAILFNIVPTLKTPPVSTVVCETKPCVCSCSCPPSSSAPVDLTHFASVGVILAAACLVAGVAVGLQIRLPVRRAPAASVRARADAETQYEIDLESVALQEIELITQRRRARLAVTGEDSSR